MKAILITFSLIISLSAGAYATQEIRYEGSGAPIHASLTLENASQNLSLVNPLLRSIGRSNVTFNEKNLELIIHRKKTVCPPNKKCLPYIPPPLRVNLTVYKIEQTECSVKYLAATPKNVKSRVYEQVIVEDFSFSNCPAVMISPKQAGFVTYNVRGLSLITSKIETATARFSVTEFIRALN